MNAITASNSVQTDVMSRNRFKGKRSRHRLGRVFMVQKAEPLMPKGSAIVLNASSSTWTRDRPRAQSHVGDLVQFLAGRAGRRRAPTCPPSSS